MKIFIYDIEKCVTFDVYDDILAIAEKKKISAKLLSTIESHERDKINVCSDDGYNFSFDARVLIN